VDPQPPVPVVVSCASPTHGDRSATPTSALAAAMAARYAVPTAPGVLDSGAGSNATDCVGGGGSAGMRFRRAIYRVLIALSFKSFRRRNETKRRRERSDCSDNTSDCSQRSDCSEARFLPAAALMPVDDDTLAPADDLLYVTAVRHPPF